MNCLNCGTQFAVEIWESVNTDLCEDLSNKIISSEFFNAKCTKCGFVAELEYDILYHDLQHGAMIWVAHKQETGYEEKIKDIRDFEVPLGYTMRIVSDINQLLEKVSALDAGRDDRVIELCKAYLRYELSWHSPDFKTAATFYTYSGGEEIILFYDENGQELSCCLLPELYDAISAKFALTLSKASMLSWEIYDAEWAEEFFNSEAEEGSGIIVQ